MIPHVGFPHEGKDCFSQLSSIRPTFGIGAMAFAGSIGNDTHDCGEGLGNATIVLGTTALALLGFHHEYTLILLASSLPLLYLVLPFLFGFSKDFRCRCRIQLAASERLST
jgi:hypothetical protein